MMNDLVETVRDRVLDILTDLKYDDEWQDEMTDVAGEGERKDVKSIVAHYIQMIENEF
jgi:hypothetical protein